ncbi:MAG: hypothetical protein KF684_13920 [Phycisphaeraceae bacterium]|nr:hypothetical protein [Phycisphaeraceae bacterium]
MPEIEFVLTETQQYGMIEFILQMGGRFLVVPYGHTVPQFPVLTSADEVLSYRGRAIGPFNVLSDLYTITNPVTYLVNNIHFGPMYSAASRSWGPVIEISLSQGVATAAQRTVGFASYYPTYFINDVEERPPLSLRKFYSQIRSWVVARSFPVRERSCGRKMFIDNEYSRVVLDDLIGWGSWVR